MSVSLQKGGNVSLTKEAGGDLSHVQVCLGWQERQTSGADFDLDASAIVLGDGEKALSEKHFVFYNNLDSPDGSVHHTGDNLTGAGDGDDEVIEVDLARMPDVALKVVFPVSIYEADQRSQNFGQVTSAYIRVVNKDTNAELVRFDLSEDAGMETCMVFGELYRDPSNAGHWKFRAIEQGYHDGLAGLARHYGIGVA